jgi:excisionase family DNA binding protein
MALLTTQQAAERIGVSVRHVQRLVAGGDLTAIGTDRVDAESVAQ